MDNQHKMIKGYRDLSADEIALMNGVKGMAELVAEIVAHVDLAIATQEGIARQQGDSDELTRIREANPSGWIKSAKEDLQTGFMKLTRAVAQPTTF